jgi:hypothetical protein
MWLALAPLALFACTRALNESARSPSGKFSGIAMADCPLSLSGASATWSETQYGIAIDFTAPAGERAELRKRAHAVAADGEEGLPNACPCSATLAASGGTESRIGPRAHAFVKDTAVGSSVVYEAKDQGEIVLLRAHMRKYLERLQDNGACP